MSRMATLAEAFPDIIRAGEALAPHTLLRLGGPAEFLAQPRSVDELAALMKACAEQKLPVRILGIGSALLVSDDGVKGVVLRLSAPTFGRVEVEGRRVRAGGGAALSALISESARHNLAGLETLVGISATVGGALRVNAGDRSGEIGSYVRRVEVLDEQHKAVWREHEELRFSENASNLDDPVILGAEFELDLDKPDAIVKRMRKAWIMRQASEPYSFESSARMFRDPRGLSAAALIEKAGLGKTKVGKAGLSERNANHVIAASGTTSRDVLRLLDLIRSKVKEAEGVTLEQELTVW
jgi:UDP-N-acetylmuramate dehydrogenase